jgi:hypothetical protein
MCDARNRTMRKTSARSCMDQNTERTETAAEPSLPAEGNLRQAEQNGWRAQLRTGDRSSNKNGGKSCADQKFQAVKMRAASRENRSALLWRGLGRSRKKSVQKNGAKPFGHEQENGEAHSCFSFRAGKQKSAHRREEKANSAPRDPVPW